MDHDLLDRIVAAYGSSDGLADAVEINRVTMRRWRSRKFEVPDWFWDALPAVLAQRAVYLRDRAGRLEQAADACEAIADEIRNASAQPPNR